MDGSSPARTATFGSSDDWTTGSTPRFRSATEESLRPVSPSQEEIRFGAFRLLPGARLLLRDGGAIEIGGRAFDLLHALASQRGSVVSKEDIFRRVWPTTVVDESNLRFQIAALRRALGEDRDMVKTVPGRGYLLAADPHGAAIPDAPIEDPRRPAETAIEARLLLVLRSALDEFWEMILQDGRLGAIQNRADG